MHVLLVGTASRHQERHLSALVPAAKLRHELTYEVRENSGAQVVGTQKNDWDLRLHAAWVVRKWHGTCTREQWFFLLLMSVVVRTLFLVDENDSDDHRDS